jgi:tetratricopeptide (TPR) repeat protein
MRGSLLRRLVLAVSLLAPFVAQAAGTPVDPYFREALYYAHQDYYFSALARLDAELVLHHAVDEPRLDLLYADIGEAEFSVGDFELRYRMHQRAGRAMTRVIEGDVAPEVRADAIYRLARLHYQNGEPALALATLDRIESPMSASLRADQLFLRGNVLMALGRPDEAAAVLEDVDDADSLVGFASYNLAIAHLESEDPAKAVRRLDQAGRIRAGGREARAIRDKANLVLGTLLFEAEDFDRARTALDRVRLDGPYSNEALLRAGWAEVSAERFDRAVVPWATLAERDATDEAVQEALLALPFAYSRLEVHGRAAVLYEHAAKAYGDELQKLDASIDSVREGRFLAALEDERIRRDSEWVVRMRELPDAPETFYLISLMASHPFQTGLQNYLDLSDMRRRLMEYRRSLDAFEDLIEVRREYYAPRLPEIDRRFRRLDAQMRLRLEQRARVEAKLRAMLTAPAPRLLATAEELRREAELDALAAWIDASGAPEGLERRVERLRGVLRWRIETGYQDRLARLHAALEELTVDVEALQERYDVFVRVRQAAEHGHAGFDDRITRLRRDVQTSIQRIDRAREAQGQALQAIAIRELRGRRGRLEEYQNKARFAFADSYDRAVKQQMSAR